MKRLILLTAILLAVSTASFADIAPAPGKSPNRVKKPDPGIASTLVIKLDQNEKVARLEIPKSQLKQLRAELEELDRDTDTAAGVAEGPITRTQTIVSGAFLSLAFVFGGIWFVRSGRSPSRSKTLVLIAAAAGIGSAVTFVYANVGPPPEAREITSKLFDQKVFFPYKQASGAIRLATKENGNYVELIVPDVSPTPSGEE